MCILSIYGYNVCLLQCLMTLKTMNWSREAWRASPSGARQSPPPPAAAAAGSRLTRIAGTATSRRGGRSAPRRRRLAPATPYLHRRLRPPVKVHDTYNAYYAYIDILLYINAYLMYGLAYIVNLHSLHKFYRTLLGLNTCQIAPNCKKTLRIWRASH